MTLMTRLLVATMSAAQNNNQPMTGQANADGHLRDERRWCDKRWGRKGGGEATRG